MKYSEFIATCLNMRRSQGTKKINITKGNRFYFFVFVGQVTNIPANMVVDQFGMIGLLTFIRAAETDPNLVSLALGADLTTLGLNLNSEVNLFPTFGGPWAETPCRPQDIDFHVPHEYLTNTAIRLAREHFPETQYLTKYFSGKSWPR